MHRMFRALFIALVAVASIAVPANASADSPPAAGKDSPFGTTALACDSWTDFRANSDGEVIAQIPTAGWNSRNRNCFLGRGNVSDGVWVLQDAIVLCYGIGIAIDGRFGADTQSALMAVQSSHGITADGVFGPITSQAMRWPRRWAADWNIVFGCG